MSKKVAILSTHGFEESELQSPKSHLEKEGFQVEIVSPEQGSIKSWADGNWGKEYPVDKTLDEAQSTDYDALVIPGGVINPDKLRTNDKALNFVKDFYAERKPIAAICHGPQVLIDAQVINGKKLTSVGAITQDLKNAGAVWVDQEVIEDEQLITSRVPKDLPAFNAKIVEVLNRAE